LGSVKKMNEMCSLRETLCSWWLYFTTRGTRVYTRGTRGTKVQTLYLLYLKTFTKMVINPVFIISANITPTIGTIRNALYDGRA